MRLLIVDDEEAARYGMRRALSTFGYDVSEAESAEVARALVKQQMPDLMLLDVNLPGVSGLDFLRELQPDNGSAPLVVIITAHGSERMAVEAVKAGAYDYLAKPFEPRELLARVRAIIRRSNIFTEPEKRQRPTQTYKFDGWTIDVARRRLWTADEVVVTLTTAEFDLLCVFVTHPQRTLTRDQLLNLTQGQTAQPFDRSIDILVSRLRKKLGGGSDKSTAIVTVRGGGYMFSPSVQPA